MADSAGAFSLTIPGHPGDQLFVRQADQAGNQSTSEQLHYSIGVLSFTIQSPMDGAVVESRSVTLRGELIGPLGAALSISGIPAAIHGNGSVRQFVVTVPLAPLENTIAAVAKTPDGRRVERTLHVLRTGGSPFEIEANVTEGAAPLSVVFEVIRYLNNPIEIVEADFDGDGTMDVTQGTTRPGPMEHQYTQPGAYVARFTVRSQGTARSYQVPITVHSSAELSDRVLVTWGRFLEGLRANSPVAVSSQMTPECAERFGPLFNQLQGSLPQIATTFSAPEFVSVFGQMAEYSIIRSVDGEQRVYLIYFVRGSDGVWRIANL